MRESGARSAGINALDRAPRRARGRRRSGRQQGGQLLVKRQLFGLKLNAQFDSGLISVTAADHALDLPRGFFVGGGNAQFYLRGILGIRCGYTTVPLTKVRNPKMTPS